jgi:hypothetical protein
LCGSYTTQVKEIEMEGTEDDDPHDESTHWIGKIREESVDSHERDAERDTRRKQQPNVQRKKPPMEKGR